MRTSELMMWKRSVTPQNILQTLLTDPAPWLIPHLWGSEERQVKLTGARKKSATLRFQVKRSCRGLIYPGGASDESPTSVSTNSHTATPRLWDPPTRLPFQQGVGSERSRGRAEETPSLAQVFLKLIYAAKLCPDHPARACQRSPQLLAPGERRTNLAPCACTPTVSQSRDRIQG